MTAIEENAEQVDRKKLEIVELDHPGPDRRFRVKNADTGNEATDAVARLILRNPVAIKGAVHP